LEVMYRTDLLSVRELGSNLMLTPISLPSKESAARAFISA